MKRVLVTCAHPDDETLGLGGVLALHARKNEDVYVLVFADGEWSRKNREYRILERKKQAQKACKILGIKKIQFLDYLDQKLDTVPLSELSSKIEAAINLWKPEIIYTHFWGDVNQDHRQVFEATQIAARPTPESKIKKFICYETPSSTEWGNKELSFAPNYFVNIESVIERKTKAFLEYKKETKEYPHPRSKKALLNRAQYWGNIVGLHYAEAFVIIRELKK